MNQDYVDLLRAFVDHEVRFMVVGAYALAVHGRPRATGDGTPARRVQSLHDSEVRAVKGPTLTTRFVVLREVEDVDGSRLLTAALTSEGDLVIEGRDYGSGVERVFGVREYEWVWTIPAASVGDLRHVMQAAAADDVLAAFRDRFSGERAADLGTFLESNRIPTKRWSRLGD
jgi:hypothetical protein